MSSRAKDRTRERDRDRDKGREKEKLNETVNDFLRRWSFSVPPLGGAGDHRVGGGAGPPTTFSTRFTLRSVCPPGALWGVPPTHSQPPPPGAPAPRVLFGAPSPPNPNLHPPGLLPPGSSLGYSPHPSPPFVGSPVRPQPTGVEGHLWTADSGRVGPSATVGPQVTRVAGHGWVGDSR